MDGSIFAEAFASMPKNSDVYVAPVLGVEFVKPWALTTDSNRSDFKGCNCDSYQAADLDDHQPKCGAHGWARMHQRIYEFLYAVDAFPTRDIAYAMAERLTEALHQK
ncbi:hypothetical protein [Mycolicibacterium sp. A43C]